MPRRGCVERMPVARLPFDPDQKQERSQAAWRGRQPAERDTHPPPPKPRYHHRYFTSLHIYSTPPPPPSSIYVLYHHPHHPSLGLPVGPGSLQHSLPVAPHPQTPLICLSLQPALAPVLHHLLPHPRRRLLVFLSLSAAGLPSLLDSILSIPHSLPWIFSITCPHSPRSCHLSPLR